MRLGNIATEAPVEFQSDIIIQYAVSLFNNSRDFTIIHFARKWIEALNICHDVWCW